MIMYQRVRAFIRENKMIPPEATVIAGVSGGGDSMAMLYFLKRYREEADFSIRVVHVNHQIRGEEAQRDSAFVQEICRQWEIPCRVYSYPVPKLAGEWKMGLEEAGREVRKKAFQEETRRLGADSGQARVALAHNQDDLAETMVHHLARGTGIRGLCTMRPSKDGIIRPVLCLEKREIVHYLKEKEIPFLLDSSNLSDDYTRNRIRHHILPLLNEQVNSRASFHMAQTAYAAAQAEDYLCEKGREVLKQCRRDTDGYFLGDAFARAAQAEKTYALQQALEELAGGRRDLTFLHVQKLLELENMQTGRKVCLPYGLYGEKTYGGIFLGKGSEKKEPQEGQWELPLSGTLACPYGIFFARIFPWENQKIEEKKYTKWLDYDKIKNKLSVRTRLPGDFLALGGEGGRKKVSRIMIDDKIPAKKREEIPLVADGQEIVWIIGGRINERYKVTPHTGRVLELQYEGGNIHE